MNIDTEILTKIKLKSTGNLKFIDRDQVRFIPVIKG